MLISSHLLGFGVLAPPPIAFINAGSAQTTASNSLTAPADIQAGDILLFGNFAISGSTPSAAVPSGFTSVTSINNGSNTRYQMSWKLSNGTEGGSTLTGMNGTNFRGLLVVVLRPNRGIASVSAGAAVSDGLTTGNPSSQVIASGSASTAHALAIAGYMAGGSAIDPRTFSPTKDGEQNNATDGLWLAWKVFRPDIPPTDVTIDMDDEGNNNGIIGTYLNLTVT